MTKPRQRERGEQAGIVQLLRALGAQVYVSGTTRRAGDFHGTMQTPGIPDIEAFVPHPHRHGHQAPGYALVKIEVKAKGGRLRPAQAVYRNMCEFAGVAHVVGGLDDVIAWLLANGYLKATQVPHYRVPAKPVEAGGPEPI